MSKQKPIAVEPPNIKELKEEFRREWKKELRKNPEVLARLEADRRKAVGEGEEFDEKEWWDWEEEFYSENLFGPTEGEPEEFSPAFRKFLEKRQEEKRGKSELLEKRRQEELAKFVFGIPEKEWREREDEIIIPQGPPIQVNKAIREQARKLQQKIPNLPQEIALSMAVNTAENRYRVVPFKFSKEKEKEAQTELLTIAQGILKDAREAGRQMSNQEAERQAQKIIQEKFKSDRGSMDPYLETILMTPDEDDEDLDDELSESRPSNEQMQRDIAALIEQRAKKRPVDPKEIEAYLEKVKKGEIDVDIPEKTISKIMRTAEKEGELISYGTAQEIALARQFVSEKEKEGQLLSEEEARAIILEKYRREGVETEFEEIVRQTEDVEGKVLPPEEKYIQEVDDYEFIWDKIYYADPERFKSLKMTIVDQGEAKTYRVPPYYMGYQYVYTGKKKLAARELTYSDYVRARLISQYKYVTGIRTSRQIKMIGDDISLIKRQPEFGEIKRKDKPQGLAGNIGDRISVVKPSVRAEGWVTAYNPEEGWLQLAHDSPSRYRLKNITSPLVYDLGPEDDLVYPSNDNYYQSDFTMLLDSFCLNTDWRNLSLEELAKICPILHEYRINEASITGMINRAGQFYWIYNTPYIDVYDDNTKFFYGGQSYDFPNKYDWKDPSKGIMTEDVELARKILYIEHPEEMDDKVIQDMSANDYPTRYVTFDYQEGHINGVIVDYTPNAYKVWSNQGRIEIISPDTPDLQIIPYQRVEGTLKRLEVPSTYDILEQPVEPELRVKVVDEMFRLVQGLIPDLVTSINIQSPSTKQAVSTIKPWNEYYAENFKSWFYRKVYPEIVNSMTDQLRQTIEKWALQKAQEHPDIRGVELIKDLADRHRNVTISVNIEREVDGEMVQDTEKRQVPFFMLPRDEMIDYLRNLKNPTIVDITIWKHLVSNPKIEKTKRLPEEFMMIGKFLREYRVSTLEGLAKDFGLQIEQTIVPVASKKVIDLDREKIIRMSIPERIKALKKAYPGSIEQFPETVEGMRRIEARQKAIDRFFSSSNISRVIQGYNYWSQRSLAVDISNAVRTYMARHPLDRDKLVNQEIAKYIEREFNRKFPTPEDHNQFQATEYYARLKKTYSEHKRRFDKNPDVRQHLINEYRSTIERIQQRINKMINSSQYQRVVLANQKQMDKYQKQIDEKQTQVQNLTENHPTVESREDKDERKTAVNKLYQEISTLQGYIQNIKWNDDVEVLKRELKEYQDKYEELEKDNQRQITQQDYQVLEQGYQKQIQELDERIRTLANQPDQGESINRLQGELYILQHTLQMLRGSLDTKLSLKGEKIMKRIKIFEKDAMIASDGKTVEEYLKAVLLPMFFLDEHRMGKYATFFRNNIASETFDIQYLIAGNLSYFFPELEMNTQISEEMYKEAHRELDNEFRIYVHSFTDLYIRSKFLGLHTQTKPLPPQKLLNWNQYLTTPQRVCYNDTETGYYILRDDEGKPIYKSRKQFGRYISDLTEQEIADKLRKYSDPVEANKECQQRVENERSRIQRMIEEQRGHPDTPAKDLIMENLYDQYYDDAKYKSVYDDCQEQLKDPLALEEEYDQLRYDRVQSTTEVENLGRYTMSDGQVVYLRKLNEKSVMEPVELPIPDSDLIICYSSLSKKFSCHSRGSIMKDIIQSKDENPINPYTQEPYPRSFVEKMKKRYGNADMESYQTGLQSTEDPFQIVDSQKWQIAPVDVFGLRQEYSDISAEKAKNIMNQAVQKEEPKVVVEDSANFKDIISDSGKSLILFCDSEIPSCQNVQDSWNDYTNKYPDVLFYSVDNQSPGGYVIIDQVQKQLVQLGLSSAGKTFMSFPTVVGFIRSTPASVLSISRKMVKSGLVDSKIDNMVRKLNRT